MVRIRTDGEYSHRKDTIQDAKRAWGVDSQTQAILRSCELAVDVLDELEALLEDERLPPEVAADLVDRLDRSRNLSADYTPPTASLRPGED